MLIFKPIFIFSFLRKESQGRNSYFFHFVLAQEKGTSIIERGGYDSSEAATLWLTNVM